MLEHIDRTVKETLEELKEKNPLVGEAYENAVLERAFAFRDRPNPSGPGSPEIKEAGTEISERVKIINRWYEKYQDGAWNKVKTESPDLVRVVWETMDSIDKSFEKWKDGTGGWEEVDSAIMDYANAWREIAAVHR